MFSLTGVALREACSHERLMAGMPDSVYILLNEAQELSIIRGFGCAPDVVIRECVYLIESLQGMIKEHKRALLPYEPREIPEILRFLLPS